LLIFFVFLSSFFSSAFPAFAQSPIGTLEGMVLQVSSGSNITINSFGTEINVRLYGIDAPVMPNDDTLHGWMRRPGQPHARAAFMALANKVLHQNVTIEIMTIASSQQYPHHQAVAIVFLDGRDINREMLAEGWGWVLRKDLDKLHVNEYIAAEHVARIKKLGLWARNNPLPPWEFRKKWRGDNIEPRP
jgi:endonuclease YncB( thermonuclease family)